jgi:hypothetical protein
VEKFGYDAIMKGTAEERWNTANKAFQLVKGQISEGIYGPVDWTNPKDKRGAKSVRICQVQKGKMVPISDWIEAPPVAYEELFPEEFK